VPKSEEDRFRTQGFWNTVEVPFYYDTGNIPVWAPPIARYDTGNYWLNIPVNLYFGVCNLFSMAVNLIPVADHVVEQGLRKIGFSEGDIEAYRLYDPEVGVFRLAGLLLGELKLLTRGQRAARLKIPPPVDPRIQKVIGPGGGTIPVLNIQTNHARMFILEDTARRGNVKWVAGDIQLLNAAEEASMPGRKMEWSAWRDRFGNRVNIKGRDVHHWKYKGQYHDETFNPFNLYVMDKEEHTYWGGIHTAMGSETAPTKVLAWGVEPEIQSMFNFWIAKAPNDDVYWARREQWMRIWMGLLEGPPWKD
jgi:hypothetical protein